MAPEVLLEDLIHSFGLTICLRMSRRRKFPLDLQARQESFPEFRHELRPAIGYDVVGQPVQFEHVRHHQIRRIRGGDPFAAWDEMRHFGCAIDDHQY